MSRKLFFCDLLSQQLRYILSILPGVTVTPSAPPTDSVTSSRDSASVSPVSPVSAANAANATSLDSAHRGANVRLGGVRVVVLMIGPLHTKNQQ